MELLQGILQIFSAIVLPLSDEPPKEAERPAIEREAPAGYVGDSGRR